MRHHAGRSSLTLISLERISSTPPGATGSKASRMINRRPLPQSRSPPSQTASAWGMGSAAMTAGSVGDAGRAVGEELDQLGAADHDRAGDQLGLVEAAALEARRAHEDLAAGLGEVGHQVLQRREARL